MDSINQNLNPVRNRISNGVKKKIMRRVYAIWLFKGLTSPFAIKAISLVALSVWLTTYVSIGNVLENAVSSISLDYILSFFASAFSKTELAAKVLLLVFLIPFSFLLKDAKSAIWRLFFKKENSFQFASR